MLTNELKVVVDYAYGKVKMALEIWNDLSMQQIRLRTANISRIELDKQKHEMIMFKHKLLADKKVKK